MGKTPLMGAPLGGFLGVFFVFGAIVAASRVLHASAIFPVFAVILYLSLFN